MRIEKVEYRKRFNLGNYETEEIGFTAEIEPGDEPRVVLEMLRHEVHQCSEKRLEVPARAETPAAQPAEQKILDFDAEDLMAHSWKGQRIDKQDRSKGYKPGSLAWGWDFQGEFSEPTIQLLKKGPHTIDQYEFSLDEGLVHTTKIGEGKKPTASKPTEPPVAKVQARFPADLADLLYLELTEEYVLVKPRQYLGSDNFRRISAIVREELNGEYVSAGRESHFRIPREK